MVVEEEWDAENGQDTHNAVMWVDAARKAEDVISSRGLSDTDT